MSIWSAATIQRFLEEGEIEIAQSLKCIIARTSLSVVAATATYTLPSDLYTVSRITWKGKKIEPCSARDYHLLNNVSESRSEPLFYVFNQQGQNTIRFHPVPSLTIASTASNLFGSEIENRVIVEYYQITNSSTVLLPQYIRRRLLKYYVLMRCFSIEGKGQNLKVAKKMSERFEFYMGVFKKMYGDTFISVLQKLGGGNKTSILGLPRLPYTFGEEGEF